VDRGEPVWATWCGSVQTEYVPLPRKIIAGEEAVKPKIGIVGTGETVGIAHYHALGILADGRADIAAVYDVNPDSANRFLREHNLQHARLCASYTQLLECVDAVDICTPN